MVNPTEAVCHKHFKKPAEKRTQGSWQGISTPASSQVAHAVGACGPASRPAIFLSRLRYSMKMNARTICSCILSKPPIQRAAAAKSVVFRELSVTSGLHPGPLRRPRERAPEYRQPHAHCRTAAYRSRALACCGRNLPQTENLPRGSSARAPV